MVRSLLFFLAVLALPCTFAEVGYGVSRSKSVKGYTISKVCGGLPAVVAACNDNPKCKGFDMRYEDEDPTGCGELKTRVSGGTQEEESGSTSFCKFLRPSQPGFDETDCPGSYTLWPDADAPDGSDYNCRWTENGVEKDYCRADGTPVNVLDECTKSKAFPCGAFVIQNEKSGQYGFLKKPYWKSGGRRVPRKGVMLFVKGS